MSEPAWPGIPQGALEQAYLAIRAVLLGELPATPAPADTQAIVGALAVLIANMLITPGTDQGWDEAEARAAVLVHIENQLAAVMLDGPHAGRISPLPPRS